MFQKRDLILIIISSALAGGVIGFSGGALVQSPVSPSGNIIQPTPQNGKVILEEDVPVPLDTLANPIISEWRGSADGTLVAKTDTTFTLEKDGYRLTVLFSPGFSRIYQAQPPPTTPNETSNEPARELTLDEVPLNVRMLGSVWLPHKDGTLPIVGTKGEALAVTFTAELPE